MNERDRLRALEDRNPRPGVARLVLQDHGNGVYVHRGTGKTYTQEDVRRLGSTVTVIQTRVVRANHEQ